MTETLVNTGLLPVVGQDTFVPLIDGRAVRYANLDNAASSSVLSVVADRVQEVLPLYASVHRGAGYLSQVSTALYESARQTIGSFLGARTDDVTIITRNTTDSINLLASSIRGRILVLDIEHHANFLPWQRSDAGAHILAAGATVAETLSLLKAELGRTPYALLAVSGASNVTGEALPLDAVVRLAHAAGARVFVDAAQLVPHRRVSLTASGVDYIAFSGHKLYAPFGAGVLVGRRDWLDEAKPYLAGGGAVRHVGLGEVEWTVSPARHEAGSPNVVGAVALAAACEALAEVSGEAWTGHEMGLRRRLVEGLESIGSIRIARIWADAAEPVGVVTFSVAGHDPGLVAAYLSAEHGIGVRDGRFCAHPLLARLGFDAGAIRASIGVGTTAEDIDRLLGALRTYLDQGPLTAYEIVDGCWSVSDDPRPLIQVAGLTRLISTASACAPA